MFTVTKKVEYSVAFVAFMSRCGGKIVSLSEVSRRLALPYRFLGQLAYAMKLAGIVESREGVAGGYALREGWEKRRLYDLVEALGENQKIVECLGDSDGCGRKKGCRMRKVWKRLDDKIVLEMKKIKLGEI